jgi:tetratricopeptide (TPR) repeat protein
MRWVVALLCVSHVAFAETPKQRADKLFEDGRRYLVNKEYALACTAFEQSQQADPAIGTQLNIALCYEEWGHVAAAYKAFQEAYRLAAAKHDNRTKVAQKKIDELAPKVPYLTLDVPPGADTSAVFLMDGKELAKDAFSGEMPVEPGEHAIEARVPGQDSKVTKVTVQLGDHKHVALDVPKPKVVIVQKTVITGPPPLLPRKTGRLWGGIALAGSGAVAVGIASYVALIARSDYNTAIKDCPGGVCTSRKTYLDTQNAISRANEMTYVAGAGIALAAVGVYLIATSGGGRAEQPKVGVTVTPNSFAIGGAW